MNDRKPLPNVAASASESRRVDSLALAVTGKSLMSRGRVGLYFLALLIAEGAFAAAATEPLPPVSGQVSGEFTPLQLAGAPTLKWKIVLRPGATVGHRAADFQIDGTGTALAGEAELETWTAGTWRLRESWLELASWFRALAARVGPPLTAMSAEGRVSLEGAGTVRDGQFGGKVGFDWRDGVLRNSTAGWSVSGIELRGRLAQIPGVASDGPVTLTYKEAGGAGITARDGRIEFAIDFNRRIHVLRATSGLMEGRVELTPFVFDPAKPEVETNAEFDRVELSRFAAYLPSVLAEARGPVSGRMQISWSVKNGLRSASGTLRPESQAASIRLAPAPGFLTSRLPASVRERIDLLPSWLGPIRNLFRPVNPAYETLRAIEMGEARLELKTLELNVTPDGDAKGRSARIVVMAKPTAKESVVDSLRFEININGPLADLVKLGLEGRVKVHAR